MKRSVFPIYFLLALLSLPPNILGQQTILRPDGGLATGGLPPSGEIPSDWWSQVREDIRKEEYTITWQEKTDLPDLGAAYQAPNRAQGFRTYFTEDGIRVVPRTGDGPSWNWGLSLAGAEARSWKSEAVKKQRPGIHVSDNRIEFDRGWITEWYINSPEGLEQGFTIPKPPAWNVAQALLPSINGAQTGESALHLDLRLLGDLHPQFAEDGQAVDFYKDGGFNVLHYAKLIVTDATGRVLPSRFEGWVGGASYELPATSYGITGADEGRADGASYQLPAASFRAGGGIRIVVDAAGAVYPIVIDPLALIPAWIGEGNQTGAWYGASAGTAGDVNGDGYSDIIVGAPFYDGGQADEGRAFLYLGGPAGPAASAGWTAESNQAGAEYGYSVGTAGDVNGDGYSDVIVGAPSCNIGETDEGLAYVYLGGPSGLAAGAVWWAQSNVNFAYFGHSVGTAGDVNGDGYSDIIVGAYYYTADQSLEGGAFLYLGGPAGPAASAGWIGQSNQASAFYGCSVGTAGDVNGDGYSDVIVGAYNYDNGQTDEGRAFLYLGSASGLATIPVWTAEGNLASAKFGLSVGTAGDVNGDGYADIIVSVDDRACVFLGSASGPAAVAAWTKTQSAQVESVGTAGDVNGDGYADVILGLPGGGSSGQAYVYAGSAAGLSPSPYWSGAESQSGASYGGSAGTAGDVNGDGYSDIIIGADHYDNGQTDEGRAYLYLGSASGPAAGAVWTAESDQAGAHFGLTAETAGDVNGDGYSDLIVGAPGYDGGQVDEGRACLYLGSASGPEAVAAWTAESDQAGAGFGGSVETAGDVNGDGYSDVIVGASSFDNGQSNEGRAYAYLGSAAGLAAGAGWTAEGDQAGALFGESVGTAGDVNGDGFSDVIVGARSYDNGQTDEGRACVYLGGPAGPAASAGWTAEGDQAGAIFGVSVGTAGDVNGDGYSDVIVGARDYDNGHTDEGRAFVYQGGASGLAAVASWTAEPNQSSAGLGYSVGTAGDVNGDGYSDVIVGAWLFDNGESGEGRAYVYHGGASGLAVVPAWTAEGNQPGGTFGRSVGTAGDVNGDGYSDVIVGAWQYDTSQVDAGRVYVFQGSASGLAAGAAWTAQSEQADARFGLAAATAGDVNGDGYSDLIVGAYRYDNGEADEGAAFVYYGGGGPGMTLRPQQRASGDSAPIASLGSAQDGLFRLTSVGRTPFGRGEVKLEWQTAPLRRSLDPAISPIQAAGAWTDSGPAGASLNEPVAIAGGPYLWRLRTRYNPVTSPFQGHGRWLTPPDNGLRETDLRRVVPCVPPTLAAFLGSVTKSGTENILAWQDPNAANQRTGWNIRRATTASSAKAAWPIVGSNVPDGDPDTTGVFEWTDTAGNPAPGTVWFYQVTAYNSVCGAEGPF